MKIYTVHRIFPNSEDVLLATDKLDAAIKCKDSEMKRLKSNFYTLCLCVEIVLWEDGHSAIIMRDNLED